MVGCIPGLRLGYAVCDTDVARCAYTQCGPESPPRGQYTIGARAARADTSPMAREGERRRICIVRPVHQHRSLQVRERRRAAVPTHTATVPRYYAPGHPSTPDPVGARGKRDHAPLTDAIQRPPCAPPPVQPPRIYIVLYLGPQARHTRPTRGTAHGTGGQRSGRACAVRWPRGRAKGL